MALNSNLLISGLLGICLGITHLFCGKLKLANIPRSSGLSFASGVSVAYVFVHILPELNEHQAVLEQQQQGIFSYLEHHVYVVALIGISVFYGLERIAKLSRDFQTKQGIGDITTINVFWLHIFSFTIYNALIGYLLVHREETDIANLVFFALAMALHFLVNDYGLRENHKHLYDRVGRWILTAGIILGWVVGSGTNIKETFIAVLFAFLAGGIILNVLKEELPEERESQFWAFILGVAIYSTLLLFLS
ncbi:MAG: hypothetical protein AAF378_03120 [Cyanobacteria bacterium P01_A01_bin.84]